MSYQLRLVAYAPNGARLGVVRDVLTFSSSYVLNDVPSLQATLPADGSGAGLLAGYAEVAVEVYNGTGWEEVPNGRFIRLAWSDDPLAESRTRQITAPGYAWLLRTATVREGGETDSEGKRKFTGATAGKILLTLIQEAKSRGALPGLNPTFSATHDSAGKPWSKVINIAYQPGLPLSTVIENLAAQGMLDWQMGGRALRAYNADEYLARPITSLVQLRPGRDVKSAPNQGDATGLVHRALLRGEEGRRWEVVAQGVPAPWGQFEVTIDQGGVSEEETAMLLIQSTLKDGSAERIQMTRELTLSPEGPLPHLNYRPGDYILGPGKSGAMERLRVHQITLTRDDKAQVGGSVVLNDRFIEDSLRRAKRTEGIVGGSKLGGGSGAQPSEVAPTDKRQPAQVEGLNWSSEVYDGPEGSTRAVVTLGWQPVDAATDGTAMTVGRYEVQGRLNSALGGDWSPLGTATGAAINLTTLRPGETWVVRVRAVSVTNIVGPWSDMVEGAVARDEEAPLAPSQPVVTSRLGAVRVEWDGFFEGQALPPHDFRYVEVALGASSAPEDLVGTLLGAGALPVTGLAMGGTFYARLRGVDRSGNVGPWSPAASVTVVGVTGEDLTAGSITANHIAAGSLTAEALSADALNGQVITGATIQTAPSGARTVVTREGIEVFDELDRLLAQIGHGIETGIALRSPKTGEMVPLSRTMFPNQTVSWEPRLTYDIPATGYVTKVASHSSQQYAEISSYGLTTWGPATRWRLGYEAEAAYCPAPDIIMPTGTTIVPTIQNPSISWSVRADVSPSGWDAEYPVESDTYRYNIGIGAVFRGDWYGGHLRNGWRVAPIFTPRTAGYPTVEGSSNRLQQWNGTGTEMDAWSVSGPSTPAEGMVPGVVYDISWRFRPEVWIAEAVSATGFTPEVALATRQHFLPTATQMGSVTTVANQHYLPNHYVYARRTKSIVVCTVGDPGSVIYASITAGTTFTHERNILSAPPTGRKVRVNTTSITLYE